MPTPKIITLLPSLLPTEKVPPIWNLILFFPAYLYLLISAFFTNLTKEFSYVE